MKLQYNSISIDLVWISQFSVCRVIILCVWVGGGDFDSFFRMVSIFSKKNSKFCYTLVCSLIQFMRLGCIICNSEHISYWKIDHRDLFWFHKKKVYQKTFIIECFRKLDILPCCDSLMGPSVVACFLILGGNERKKKLSYLGS